MKIVGGNLPFLSRSKGVSLNFAPLLTLILFGKREGRKKSHEYVIHLNMFLFIILTLLGLL